MAIWSRGFVAASLIVMTACAYVPPEPAAVPVTTKESTEVFFYPTKGQSQGQQDRDQYDCYVWAMKKTGFDPSIPQLAPHLRYRIVPYHDPNQDASAGMAAGAIIGSVVAPRNRSAEGAFVGAMIGAILGSASDAQRNEQMAMAQQQQNQRELTMDQKARNYKRAMTACLEGRGYKVK